MVDGGEYEDVKPQVFEEADFEEELRKLQELDEDRVALGHKAMTDEERARLRLGRSKTKKSMKALNTYVVNDSSSPTGNVPDSNATFSS